MLILQRDRQQYFGADPVAVSSPLQPATVLQARREVAGIHVEDMLERYIVSLVAATRDLGTIDKQWQDFLVAGASPRASIGLLRTASALAYLRGQEYLTPEIILEIAPDVLRHRIVLGYAARASGVTADDIIRRILEYVPVP